MEAQAMSVTMKILAQLKKNNRYFRRPRLTISELVKVCRDLADKRDNGRMVDVFLSPSKQTQCVAAVVRFLNASEGKRIKARLVLNPSDEKRPSPFGFTWDAWQVDDKLRINLITHKELTAIGGGIIYLLDFSRIYKDTPSLEDFEAHTLKEPQHHAAFGCVKQFVAR